MKPAETVGRQGRRMLAVDDQPILTRLLGQLLERSGWQVTPAASGEEALALLRSAAFDVVLADLALGDGMDGWQLADAIAAEWPRVRVLVASGWSAGLDPAEAQRHGVQAMLRKPYDIPEMLAALEQAVSAVG